MRQRILHHDRSRSDERGKRTALRAKLCVGREPTVGRGQCVASAARRLPPDELLLGNCCSATAMGLYGVTATAQWYAESTENCYERSHNKNAVAVVQSSRSSPNLGHSLKQLQLPKKAPCCCRARNRSPRSPGAAMSRSRKAHNSSQYFTFSRYATLFGTFTIGSGVSSSRK